MNRAAKQIVFEDFIPNHSQYVVRYDSQEFVFDDDGEQVFHRGHAVTRDVQEYHTRLVARVRYLVRCPDGIIRWMTEPEVTCSYGKKQFARARRNLRRKEKNRAAA